MKAKIPLNPNSICGKCTRRCKQYHYVQILACPNFDPIPVQLEIKFVFHRKPRKKKVSA